MTAFCEAVLAAYIRDDMAALGDPLRKDEALILQDLRFLYKAYGRNYKKGPDWTPLPAVEGRADAPDSATNINGGN